jgi:uncharacterized membrane protein
MIRPKITIQKTTLDWVLDVIAFLICLFTFSLSIIVFNDLPDLIPSHFNSKGMVDSYSSKEMILGLPFISLMIFIVLHNVNRSPHIFNYPVKITEENAMEMYRYATRLIRVMNLVIVVFFSYINFQIISNAKGVSTGLGVYALPVFLFAIFAPIGVYLYLTLRAANFLRNKD